LILIHDDMKPANIANNEPHTSIRRAIERGLGFSPLSLFLLFGPALLAVTQANAIADRFYAPISSMLNPLLAWIGKLPMPIAFTFGGDYGVFAMLPFLLLYALPTILIFTCLIAIYKSTGLIDRLSFGLNPLLKPFGLEGHDLVRIIMGFGCNVPAIVSTRSCSSCSRGTCVSAIAFGSACSYQLPATLAVIAAAGFPWLGPCYLAVLAITTLVYLRLTKPTTTYSTKEIRTPQLEYLRTPDWRKVGQDVIKSLKDFTFVALPIFVVICFIAGIIQWSGALVALTSILKPVMVTFNLPPEAALAIVLGSVRKDGIAIGLLNGDMNSLKIAFDNPFQVLTTVYLASVLLPCLVTVLTIWKEMSFKFAIKMIARQASFAALFALGIAWLGFIATYI